MPGWLGQHWTAAPVLHSTPPPANPPLCFLPTVEKRDGMPSHPMKITVISTTAKVPCHGLSEKVK